jgi:hypothetical protein
MTGRKLFQLQLETEELGRGSRLQFYRYCSFFLATNIPLAGKNSPQSDQLNDKKKRVVLFRWPMAASRQSGVASCQKLTYEARLRDSRPKLRIGVRQARPHKKIQKFYLHLGRFLK